MLVGAPDLFSVHRYKYLFDSQPQPAAQTARERHHLVEQQPGGRLVSPNPSPVYDPWTRPASLVGTDVPLGQRSWKTWFWGGPERRSVKLRLKTPNEAWSHPEPRPATYRRTGPKDELRDELVLKVVDVVQFGPADGFLQIGDEIVGVGKTRWGWGESKVRAGFPSSMPTRECARPDVFAVRRCHPPC